MNGINIRNQSNFCLCKNTQSAGACSIRLCQENGTWSGDEAECQMRSCGPVYAPKNGRLECSSEDYVIDSECSFSCNDGFTLVGSQKRVCLPIGYWDGLPAFCKRKFSCKTNQRFDTCLTQTQSSITILYFEIAVYCNPLAKVVNGTLSPAKCSMAKMRYGDRCNATCAVGFELRGPSTRLCSGLGAWSDEDTKVLDSSTCLLT